MNAALLSPISSAGNCSKQDLVHLDGQVVKLKLLPRRAGDFHRLRASHSKTGSYKIFQVPISAWKGGKEQWATLKYCSEPQLQHIRKFIDRKLCLHIPAPFSKQRLWVRSRSLICTVLPAAAPACTCKSWGATEIAAKTPRSFFWIVHLDPNIFHLTGISRELGDFQSSVHDVVQIL